VSVKAFLAAAVLALALAAPALGAPRLTPAERASINKTLDIFVNHAVKRQNPAAAYDFVAPELRAGTSRKAWAKGNIPVYPFPAAGHTFHGWTVLYVTREEVGAELELLPRRHSKVSPIIFHVYFRPVRGRWLVDSFMPAATLAPIGSNKPSVVAANDFAPAGRGEGNGNGPSRLNHIYLVIPFATMGLVVLALVGLVVAARVRDRRVVGFRRKDLPPSPRGISARRGA